MATWIRICVAVLILGSVSDLLAAPETPDDRVVRVFIFAGQSNMEGADSRIGDIRKFPPYVGLEKPLPRVKFSYQIGRANPTSSRGWVDLRSVRDMVGPELSFARAVTQQIEAPIAIIKCAAGGTHLGGDWNPDHPIGFKLYPRALALVQESLALLDEQGTPYRLEGFMWHQGENDLFNEEYLANYGANLDNFVDRWRRDLDAPRLRFYVGELCTKTIWGMDLRPYMYAISQQQKSVAKSDPLVDYVPTAHIGVEIGEPVGLHYHYGTLGQLQHGENYAKAYLRTIGKAQDTPRPLEPWPYPKDRKIRLFVLAGHRNMEGERAFTQELAAPPGGPALLRDNPAIAFRYHLGGGYRTSPSWEPLGPVDYYDTIGPELSFAQELQTKLKDPIAIAKFTHSGSQIIDWTPEGSEATTRHLYPTFLAFIRESLQDLRQRGHEVQLTGIFYHLGENDMSFYPYRKEAAQRLQATITQLRHDLDLPTLPWFVSQQPPTDHKSVNAIDVVSDLKKLATTDPHLHRIDASKVPGQEQKLVITTPGIVELGRLLARAYLDRE